MLTLYEVTSTDVRFFRDTKKIKIFIILSFSFINEFIFHI